MLWYWLFGDKHTHPAPCAEFEASTARSLPRPFVYLVADVGLPPAESLLHGSDEGMGLTCGHIETTVACTDSEAADHKARADSVG